MYSRLVKTSTGESGIGERPDTDKYSNFGAALCLVESCLIYVIMQTVRSIVESHFQFKKHKKILTQIRAPIALSKATLNSLLLFLVNTEATMMMAGKSVYVPPHMRNRPSTPVQDAMPSKYNQLKMKKTKGQIKKAKKPMMMPVAIMDDTKVKPHCELFLADLPAPMRSVTTLAGQWYNFDIYM